MSGLDPGRLAEIARGIPRYNTAVGMLYRIHRAEKSAVYFSRNTVGRFDPPLTPGTEFGTCYLGTDRLTAYVEVLGRTNPISETMIAERALTEVAISRPVLIADLTDRRLLGKLGAIPEVSVGPDYGGSRRLEAARGRARRKLLRRHQVLRPPPPRLPPDLGDALLFGEVGAQRRQAEPDPGRPHRRGRARVRPDCPARSPARVTRSLTQTFRKRRSQSERLPGVDGEHERHHHRQGPDQHP